MLSNRRISVGTLFKILQFLERQTTPLSPVVVYQTLNIKQPNFSISLKILVEQGLVVVDGFNKKRLISLTTKGKSLISLLEKFDFERFVD